MPAEDLIPMTSRRRFLGRLVRGVLWTGIAGGGSSYAYARMIERHRPVIERVRIPLTGLGSAFDGFRIVQISDLHLEPNFDAPLLVKTVAMINELQPDLVAITGDFITHDASRVAHLTEPLAGLKAKAGVVGSLGNHDVWTAARSVTKTLTDHGLKILCNGGFNLTRQNESLWIAGLDSVWAGNPDVAAAIKGKPQGAPCVMLAHEPDYADHLKLWPVNLLQLAGHTHGGQVCIPGGIPVLLPEYGKKYARGLFQVGKQQLYVNRGLGTLGPKARFSCSPEITEITLCQA